MSKLIGIAALGAALALASVSFAQAPASAPAGSTGLCKDGSYYSGASKKGACAGHKGVKEWYGAAATPVAAAATAPAAAKPAKAASALAATAAPGGGPGMVWVNKSTKAYHCSTDKYYGKTKDGEYLSEANAKAQGFHAAHGKACQ
jgi:hypothetical protein